MPGVPAGKVRVVPEAVDTGHFDPAKVHANSKLMPGLETTFAFLSVFKWEDRKNPRGLLEAYLREFNASEPVTLYLRTGSDAGAVQAAVDALAEQFALASPPRVVWVPKVSHAEYAQLYAGADAFVLPTHAEGWGACGRAVCFGYPNVAAWLAGRPLVEAMAMALPVIATNW
jgi:glycosyltransferase involved in cell wall biosynthesis